VKQDWHPEELALHWTLSESELELLGTKTGATRLSFAILLKATDAIKRANPASWKHVNLYGAYSFLDIGDGVDLQELVNLLEAARGRDAAAPD
jgi:hypothetical protein